MNPRLPHEWLRRLVTTGGFESDDGWRWRIDPTLRMGGFGPFSEQAHRIDMGEGVPVVVLAGNGQCGQVIDRLTPNMQWFSTGRYHPHIRRMCD